MKCQKASCGREIVLKTEAGDPIYRHADGDDSHGAQVPLAKEPKA